MVGYLKPHDLRMTLDDLDDWLTEYDWRSAFEARTLVRGANYALTGHVRELALLASDKNSCVVGGRVSGRGGRLYDCRVDIATAERWLLLDSSCTCPVGSACKHAAAMLLAVPDFLDPDDMLEPNDWQVLQSRRHNEAELARWQQWLASLDQADPAAPTAEPERCFGVLIRSNTHDDGLLALPAWLRPAKSGAGGNWVSPQGLQLSAAHGPLPAPVEGWPEPVAMALAVLLGAPQAVIGGQRWIPVSSVHVEHALQTLFARYRVWFERGSQALERGPALAPQWRWVEADDGSQRLSLEVDPACTRLLRGAQRTWYVQVQAGLFGEVEADATLLERLRHAPVLRPEQAASVRKRLAARPGGSSLPLPVDRGPAQPVRALPRPGVLLTTAEMKHWNGKTLIAGVAQLHFNYAGHRVPAHDDERIVTRRGDVGIGEKGIHEIHRNLEAESSWVRQLLQAGLVRGHESQSSYYFKDDRDRFINWFVQAPRSHTPLTPEQWEPTVAKLETLGFALEFATGFPHDKLVDIDQWHAELTPSGNAWFDVTLGVDIGGERVDLLPVLRQLVADPAFPRAPAKNEKPEAPWRVRLDDTRSIELPLTQLRNLIEPLLEWLETESHGEPRIHVSQADALDGTALPWHGGDALRAKLQQLRTRPISAKAPRGFKATLRPYQNEGLAWLDFLAAAGLGGILADDMGLGKTVQVLAHILGEKLAGRMTEPTLVIAPTSLVGNWQAEAERFAPTLKVLVLHGADRADHYERIADHDLIITTYPLLPRDRDKLIACSFALLVLDEAQAIKNAASQAAHVVREIPAKRRLAMTGTPLENHLGELWAQFDAVEPGLLGSARHFTKFYRTPIEKHGDSERQQRLNRKVGPLLLRRRKDDVLTDLPPKTEILRTLELEGEQRALYETLRLAQHERVRQAVAERGLAKSGIIVLDALLKLRQACCDPRLVKLASAKKVTESAKLEALLELLDGLIADGRRVLLFSQFTGMLALIEAALQQRKIAYQTLTGQTPARERTALVKRFQQGDVPLFLISLKAGGTGLNLTAADTVIHYDPWWNPAVEAQATDRAHRIGQDKPVFVYRLICKDTVEEKIQAMQTRKASLARALLEGGGASTKAHFNEADLDALFGGV